MPESQKLQLGTYFDYLDYSKNNRTPYFGIRESVNYFYVPISFYFINYTQI